MNFLVAFSSSDGLLRKAKGLGLLENYALIGGFAVAVHGVPRATEDIDFAVDLREQDCAGLAEFLKAQYSPGEEGDPLAGLFSFVLPDAQVRVQMVRFPADLSQILFAEVEKVEVDNTFIPTVSWPALVLLKLYAGSPSDLEDARRIIAAQSPAQEVLADLERKATKLGLGDLLRKISG